jgi:polyferredoxin
MSKKAKKAGRLRTYVQLFFFLLIALIVVNHSLHESGVEIPILSSASIHAVCPFGGVVSIYEYFVNDRFTKKIHESSWILMWITLSLSLVFGGVFCGWVCPFGTFQEWVGKLGKKIFRKKFNHFIPYSIDKWLRYLRYVVLALVLYMTAVSGKLFFEEYDPYYALFRFWTGEVAISALIVLGLVIVLNLFVERPFCKYACPYGAVLGVFNLFRIFSIKRNSASCIDCDLCNKNCPMNIPVATSQTIHNHQCTTCMQCTSEQFCPVKNTVELMTGKIKEAS